MSSIFPSEPGYAGGGSSINPNPTVNAAEWSRYDAVSDVDLGGNTIVNGYIADLSQTLVDETLKGTTTLFTGHEFSGVLQTDNVVRFKNVTTPLILQKGDSSTPPVLESVQIQLAFNNTDDYSHYITTEHYGGLSENNEIKFWTSDGTQAGVFPANAVLGLNVTNGGIKVPRYIELTGDQTIGGDLSVNGTGAIARVETSYLDAQEGTDIIARDYVDVNSYTIELNDVDTIPSRMFVKWNPPGTGTLTVKFYREILKPVEIVILDYPGASSGNTLVVQTYSDSGLIVTGKHA